MKSWVRSSAAFFGLLIPASCVSLSAQEVPANVIGWYNGDWQTGMGGLASYYASDSDYSCVYDNFVVPDGGWTVTGVFAHLQMDSAQVNSAFWEIRVGVSEGDSGTVVASGISPAIQILNPSTAYAYVGGPDTLIGYRIEVGGLNVTLSPGKYWLTIVPVTDGTARSYVDATRGMHAAGNPRGNDGLAFVNSTLMKTVFSPAGKVNKGGNLGIATDFSQGVIIAKAP